MQPEFRATARPPSVLPDIGRLARAADGLRAASALVLGLCLAACGAGAPGSASGLVQASPAAAGGQVSIRGGRLVRDGTAWVPRGYFQIAFEAGSNVKTGDFEANANAGYSPQEYADMAAAHADSVRLMISQPGADPKDPLHDAKLVPKVISAVEAARSAGLTVIIGIQDEKVVGRATRAGLPDDATRRVWQQLVPAFGGDKGILLELYNEPVIAMTQTPSAADWQTWALKMNSTIAAVRGYGATNVIVADGLDRAIVLAGAPALTDPLGQVAYAAHPYAFSDADETTALLDHSFGDFAASHPVIITEYGLGYHCSALDPGFLITFFRYLQDRGIGLEIGSWDWGGAGSFGNARYNFPAAPVVSRFYDDGVFQRCTRPDMTTGKRGPGLTVDQWYRTGIIPAHAL